MSNRMSWYAVAASDDVAELKNKGFCVNSDGEILYNEQYEYALARMYTHDGHGIVDVETSNFFFDKDSSDRITINAEDPMTTPVLSYKLRMTDQYPDAQWFYFAADKSEEVLEDGVPHPLYKADGTLATKTDYADCEFEALNPMPSEDVGMYGRFTTATFSFATYQSTADVLHVEFIGLHQEEDEYCFADRLRVVVTASPAPVFPLDLIVGMSIDNSTGNLIAVTFDYPLEENYWNTRVKSADDKELLQNLGLWVDYPEFLYGSVLNTSSYRYEIIEIYTGVGEGVAPFDLSKFYIPDYQKLSLGCTGSYSTPVKSWKLRITPAPALPTVSVSGEFGDGNWLYAWSDSSPRVTPISVNEIKGLYKYNSGTYDTGVVYDSSKSYAVIEWYSNTYLTDKGVNGVIAVVENNNYLCAKNIGSEGVMFHASRIAVCSSDLVTVVTVYNSSNVSYNAFKYTLNGTDYYYVLDGTQTDWTDDLSGIGYHVPPSLPTVTRIGNYAIAYEGMNLLPQQISPWLFTISSYINQSSYPNSTFAARRGWTASDGAVVNGSNLSCVWDDTDGGAGIYQVTRLSVKNISPSNITLYTADIYECSSLSATVITVYDNNNNPYNAFQYTANGTDYYYVLDGTQTDWTDDLTSIGYHVLYTAWFNADHTIKSSISEMEWYDLYDDNGQYITSGFPDPFTSHSFTLVNAYRGDSIVPCSFCQFSISSGHLRVNMDVNGQSLVYITYMETPTA
jgi:hypothetical protein